MNFPETTDEKRIEDEINAWCKRHKLPAFAAAHFKHLVYRRLLEAHGFHAAKDEPGGFAVTAYQRPNGWGEGITQTYLPLGELLELLADPNSAEARRAEDDVTDIRSEWQRRRAARDAAMELARKAQRDQVEIARTNAWRSQSQTDRAFARFCAVHGVDTAMTPGLYKPLLDAERDVQSSVPPEGWTPPPPVPVRVGREINCTPLHLLEPSPKPMTGPTTTVDRYGNAHHWPAGTMGSGFVDGELVGPGESEIVDGRIVRKQATVTKPFGELGGEVTTWDGTEDEPKSPLGEWSSEQGADDDKPSNTKRMF